MLQSLWSCPVCKASEGRELGQGWDSESSRQAGREAGRQAGRETRPEEEIEEEGGGL